jgi:hypothetical protein
MTEKRYNYNPFTKDFHYCDQSHSVSLYNKGKQKAFDEYIRVIVYEKKLYIRLYYPFPDITDLSMVELKQRGYALIKEYEKALLQELKKVDITINEIKYNVDNDLLEGVGIVNI